MKQIQKNAQYDLEERTFLFAKHVRALVSKLPKSIHNQEDGRQVIRSSGSVAANYIEANEALSKKDFAMRIKICRKEAKETHLWLRLLHTSETDHENVQVLNQEALELVKIFSAILIKTSSVKRTKTQQDVLEV